LAVRAPIIYLNPYGILIHLTVADQVVAAMGEDDSTGHEDTVVADDDIVDIRGSSIVDVVRIPVMVIDVVILKETVMA
jgi:hypothetical protein